MIVDRAVLGAVSSNWSEGMFSSRWGNLIGSWCVTYYRKYRKPPGKNIVSLFDEWANEGKRDKETVQLVEKFLGSLSGEFTQLKEGLNVDYVIDLASAYFNKVALKDLADQITAAIDSGNLEEAESLVNSYHKVSIGGNDGIDVLNDEEAIKRAFEV